MRWVEGDIFKLKEGEVAIVTVELKKDEVALVGAFAINGLFNFPLKKPGFYVRLPWEEVLIYKVWEH